MIRPLLYLTALASVLFLFDELFYWFLDEFLVPNYQTIDEFGFLNQILIFTLGIFLLGYTVKSLLVPLSRFIGATLGQLYPKFGYMEMNFASWGGNILFFLNSIWAIMALWKSPIHYSLWIVLELVFVSFVIFGINSSLATSPQDLENKKRNSRA